MSALFGFLAAVIGVYSLLLFVRIILSWFSGISGENRDGILARITDPYLDWWRRRITIRIGFLDFSPIVGIVFLSILQSIFYRISRFDTISLGYILSIVLISIWTIFSFILGFYFLIIVLRLIAYLTNSDTYSGFWRVIDSISQPLLYQMNRLLFGKRIVGYLKGMVVSLIVLAVLRVGGGYAIPKLAGILSDLPI